MHGEIEYRFQKIIKNQPIVQFVSNLYHDHQYDVAFQENQSAHYFNKPMEHKRHLIDHKMKSSKIEKVHI